MQNMTQVAQRTQAILTLAQYLIALLGILAVPLLMIGLAMSQNEPINAHPAKGSHSKVGDWAY